MGKFDTEYFLARRISSRRASGKNSVMVRVAVVSVAVSIAVMIVSLAVIFGFKKEITGKLTGFGSHVQIVNLDGNTSFETVPISKNQPFLAELPKIKNLTGVYPYALKGGIVRSEDAMQGVVLKGVDGTYNWSFFENNLTEGEVLSITDSARTKDILVSRSLADMMGLETGGTVDIIFIQEISRPDRFRVRGIYDSGFAELDETMVLTDLRNVQRLNRWESDRITGFELTAASFGDLDELTYEVEDVVFNTPPAEGDQLRVVNIRERYPMIFDWLGAHDVNVVVIITVMLVVALFNMISALLIILLERTSMIGILKALGMGNRSLQKMFVIRSSFIILRGMLWGNVLGVGVCLVQHFTGAVKLDRSGYFLTTVPIDLDWGFLLGINVLTFVFIVALLALPAMIISLILPEKTIRFD